MKDGEEIWIYQEQTDGTVQRHIFTVSSIKNVASSNTDILAPTTEDKQLTLVACAPLGSSLYRIAVVADYVRQDADFMYEYADDKLSTDRFVVYSMLAKMKDMRLEEDHMTLTAMNGKRTNVLIPTMYVRVRDLWLA